MKNIDKSPIIIVGMARSGTTLVSHLLGSLDGVHLEVEPHVLWKAGNFKYLADNEYELRNNVVEWIRSKLLRAAGEKILVEKSPVNSIRPDLVHAVFPEGKIVYVQRDLVRCIDSNLKRSLKRDSFKFSIILKKYLYRSGSKELEGAIGKRKLYQQVRFRDLFQFATYVLRMIWYRNVKNLLPFGPKLRGFTDIVKKEGLTSYHVRVAEEAFHCKKIYQDYYNDRFETFQLESLHRDPNEVKRLYKFCGFDIDNDFVFNIMRTFNQKAIDLSLVPGKDDKEIEFKLKAIGLLE